MRTIIGLLAALTVATSAAAQTADWQKKWDETLAAARKEGKVTVVGSPDPVMRNEVIPAFEKRYPGIGDLKRIKVTSREGGGDWNGRVWNVTLVGGSASKVVTGSDIRSIYGLRSTYFTFR